MKTQIGRTYAQIQNSRVVWIFTQADLPEFNEHDIDVVDITSLKPSPQLGWVVVGGALTPGPGLSDDELSAVERAWRDGQLSDSQWLTARHRDETDLGDSTTLTPNQYTELLTYRKALRDWLQGDEFPLTAHRPAPPDWMAAQTQ